MSNKQNCVLSVVKSYLERTNRPYSATDVFNNLNTNDNKQSKTAITKALEELADKELINEKINGKQKIYWANQDKFNDIDHNHIKLIDQQLDQLTQEYNEVERETKHMAIKVSQLEANLTPQQVSQQLTQLNKEVKELENKLESIQSKSKDFDPEVSKDIVVKHKTLVTEWKKRKRMAVNMIDTISETASKKTKDLMEEIGVETDEDFDANLPQI